MTESTTPNLASDDALRALVRAELEVVSVTVLARRLGISAQTVLAIAAGTLVRRGSLALVREALSGKAVA